MKAINADQIQTGDKQMKTTLLITAAAMFAGISPAFAVGFTISTSSSNPFSVAGTGAETLAELAGTTVTFDIGGVSQSATFSSTSNQVTTNNGGTLTAQSISGGVVDWALSNSSGGAALESITITGAALGSGGGTAFDDNPNCSTCGSNPGTASFTHAIEVNNGAPTTYFADLAMTFANGGISDGSGIDFTENIEHLTGPITAGGSTSSTPEPSTFAMLGGGLIAFSSVTRRRRKASK